MGMHTLRRGQQQRLGNANRYAPFKIVQPPAISRSHSRRSDSEVAIQFERRDNIQTGVGGFKAVQFQGTRECVSVAQFYEGGWLTGKHEQRLVSTRAWESTWCAAGKILSPRQKANKRRL